MLNSDRIRKELAGLPAEASARAPYGSGIYTGEWTERTYAELLHRAAVLLAHGECLDYALRNSIRHGVWSGLNDEERARERRRRARRPDAA